MSPRAARWIRFVVVYVSLFVLLGGAVLFIGVSDQLHHYDYQHSTDTAPDECCVTTYETLTPDQRAMVDRALAGEQTRFVFETAEPIPPTIVERGGTYHVFTYYTTFDWGDPNTFGPVLLSLVGLLAILGAIRWEHQTNPYR